MANSTTTKTRLTLFVLLLGALALSGCGAKKTARSSGFYDSSSRTVLDDGAYCNSFSSSNTKLEGKLQVYVAKDGSEPGDMISVRVTGLNTVFDSNSMYKLRFYRWRATSDTEFYRDSTPLEFTVQSTSGDSLYGTMSYISVTDVAKMKSQWGINAATAGDFFQQVNVVVEGVDYSWDALLVALEKDVSSTKSEVVGSANALMPAFTADPNIYNTDHFDILNQLHPFWEKRAQSGANFGSLAQAYCF